MINEITQDMYKHLNDSKSTNKQLNEIRKTIQDMKEEFKKRYRNHDKKSNWNPGNEKLNN
jgi:mRNA-degrading endonuclease YafQ of YafQ-DinJ toxin-antitoxin module